jgi:hypothetical protein
MQCRRVDRAGQQTTARFTFTILGNQSTPKGTQASLLALRNCLIPFSAHDLFPAKRGFEITTVHPTYAFPPRPRAMKILYLEGRPAGSMR